MIHRLDRGEEKRENRENKREFGGRAPVEMNADGYPFSEALLKQRADARASDRW